MTSSKLHQKIKYWLQAHDYPYEVKSHRRGRSWVSEFFATTTRTRASSMVTRIRLIAAEILGAAEFSVGKELVARPGKKREDLSEWRIFVEVAPRSRRSAKEEWEWKFRRQTIYPAIREEGAP